ncbi:MAG TPA: AAA family ATPase [Flavobacteriaceae bacterium]|nr:AAA family ATPase [Flavobacteriaceae bacterium]MAM28160.1 AAA family ATPase [Flavobacteriaceae bacterium]MAY52043.1 AAA family ATPase [Flavobacteriaceae bacterium]HBR54991.1 AAA family ATPase [Flavobacteriaceae bacterium]|tara:strand:- start:1826 stop:2962 length:1137 start_codon:yes stop_codon:yes gene_type:complete
MINKRLLIKNLLAHNDESSFYDKKRKIDLGSKEGKAKFLKHICALSNSNPKNNSFIVIGVEDEGNEIRGVDFFDDSKLQNLVNAYLTNAPIISYENVLFPHLPDDKVVGLVTIRPTGEITSLRKNIWKYWGGSIFLRDGSISMPKDFDIEIKDVNSEIVAAIENQAKNNIELTLDGVINFINHRHSDLASHYKVFKEIFVVCWAGNTKLVKGETYYSRVDIELINEQVKLFYSALDEVSIVYTQDYFRITEYVHLGLNNQFRYYPLEEVTINFKENGFYTIDTHLIFEPPKFNKKTLFHIYNSNNALVEKLRKGIPLTVSEEKDVRNLAETYLICYLNDFSDAKEKLLEAKPFLKSLGGEAYQAFKESVRILRKVKYN